MSGQITNNSQILESSTQAFEANMASINKINESVTRVNGLIGSVEEVSNTNAARIESMMQAFNTTSSQTESLNSMIDRFKV